MEINRNAPATADGELRIDADPQTVFSVISAIDQWSSWNPDVKSVSVDGPVQPGTVFRWKAGPSSLTSTLQVVDPPREIAWTGTTMGIKAVHVFRGSRPVMAPPWRARRSPGRGCWPVCSRATAAGLWTRASAACSSTSRPRPSAEPRRPERAPRRHLDPPVPVRAVAMLAALAYWGFTVGDGAGAWVLGVGAPLLAAVVWARQWAWLTIHSRLLAVARNATADVGRVGGRLGQS